MVPPYLSEFFKNKTKKNKKKQKKGADPVMLLKFMSNFIYKFSVSKLI